MGYPYPTMLSEKASLLKAPLHVDPAFVRGVGVAAYDSLQHLRHSNGRISCAFEWLKSGYKVHGSASHPTLQARYSVPYPSHSFAADYSNAPVEHLLVPADHQHAPSNSPPGWDHCRLKERESPRVQDLDSKIGQWTQPKLSTEVRLWD